MAHARRYFVESEKNDKERSTYALLAFQEIYNLEKQLKDFSAEERQTQRQEVIAPKLKALHHWMKEEYPKVTPKSPMGKALILIKRLERTHHVHYRRQIRDR